MSLRETRFSVAPVVLLLVACGSTLGVSETSPADERNRPLTDAAPHSALISWDVIDRAARFKTKVLATREPEVATHPGYVHVRVQAMDSRPVDCFLYDAPIITGQAFVRLLSAAEIGIDYERIGLESVLFSGNNPLLVLEAAYREEDDGASGKLFVGLVPRVKIPLVCSHEAPSSDGLRRTIQSLAGGLEPTSEFSSDSLAEGEHLCLFELWALYRAGRPVGFRQWRAAQNDAGEVSTLEIASLLGANGQELTAMDVRISEREDAEGLRLSEWLELLDGELHARAALERAATQSDRNEEGSARFSYRIAGLSPAGPVAKTLTVSEPLRSAYFAQEEIARAEARGGETQFLSFMPNYRLDQETRVHYRASRYLGAPDAQADGVETGGVDAGELHVGALRVGDSRFELLWENGQLRRRRELRRPGVEGGGIESRLLMRLPGRAECPGPAGASDSQAPHDPEAMH